MIHLIFSRMERFAEVLAKSVESGFVAAELGLHNLVETPVSSTSTGREVSQLGSPAEEPSTNETLVETPDIVESSAVLQEVSTVPASNKDDELDDEAMSEEVRQLNVEATIQEEAVESVNNVSHDASSSESNYEVANSTESTPQLTTDISASSSTNHPPESSPKVSQIPETTTGQNVGTPDSHANDTASTNGSQTPRLNVNPYNATVGESLEFICLFIQSSHVLTDCMVMT